ncbi:MAG: ATP-binding protein [Candidatus Omnitrophica bacterium]|nr:ATP-binding protein [Candidatus Omnitrophota bacterium]
MAILFLLIGIFTGFILAVSLRQKKPSQPQEFPQQQPVPQQNSSYLEDKIWYETELDFLFKFNEKLISAFDYQDAVRCITEAAHNFLSIERTVFLAWDKDSEKFSLACAMGWASDCSQGPFVIGKDSISGFVIHNREPLVVADLSKESYLNKLNKEGYLQKAFISVPVIYKNEVLGVLHVCDKKAPGPFTQREASVVMSIARVGAITLQNVRLYEQALKRAKELRIAYDELKEMQDKLTQMEKLKAIGQLASGVAHDIRNPLGIIIQGVSYLEQLIPSAEKEQLETLSMIMDSAQRADGIVASLLDFSRGTKLELRPEDIHSILESCLNLVKAELKHVKVTRQIQEGLPKVPVDKNKLMQVFINLFMNAAHAMPENGELIIRCFLKKAEEAIIVEIEDTGTGIPEENLKRIFDPFFTTKGPGKGTGLGLSVSQNIINLHKGLMEINSQVGKGTKVSVALKISKQEG